MQIFLALWITALVMAMAMATWMEYSAIRDRINGANGLIILVAGIVSAVSLPIGGAILWLLGDFSQALRWTLGTGLGVAAAYYGALTALSAYARRR